MEADTCLAFTQQILILLDMHQSSDQKLKRQVINYFTLLCHLQRLFTSKVMRI